MLEKQPMDFTSPQVLTSSSTSWNDVSTTETHATYSTVEGRIGHVMHEQCHLCVAQTWTIFSLSRHAVAFEDVQLLEMALRQNNRERCL